MADSLLNITVGLLEVPATVTERALATSGNAHSLEGLHRLMREVGTYVAKDVKVLARVDSATRGAATGTLVADVTDATTGDLLYIDGIPGHPRVTLTVVASSPTYADGEVDGSAATDTLFGDEFVSVFLGHPLLKNYFSAANVTGTVTITARLPGSWANSVAFTEAVTSNSPFDPTDMSGGDDILDQPTMTVTFGTADIVADDTISIGARVYTWKASASADGEITLSTTPGTAATNFAAAVNADTNLTGIVTAAAVTTVVTLTFVGDPRLCQHISMDYSETNATSIVLGGTVTIGTSEVPDLGSTVTGSSSVRTFGTRGAA